MFYSHEILTSERHGVATIWLVATLGPRTASRKVNRKAILGVDVPRACDTIMNPEAPMALRLQGNLLYGVSKVYSRQCLYALSDVQAMLDRMKTALRVVHGSGLDPDAGKARPEELIVPYDPSFIPELSLPALDIDFIQPAKVSQSPGNLHSSLLSINSSSFGHFAFGLGALPQLDISTPSLAVGDMGGFALASGGVSSTQNTHLSLRRSLFDYEEGVLLQPDFEFDEEGNIVDLAMDPQPELGPSEVTVRDQERATIQENQAQATEVIAMNDDSIQVGEDANDSAHNRTSPTWGRLPDPEYVEETHNAPVGRKRRGARMVAMDEQSQIGRVELAQWQSEYLRNMSLASKQRNRNKCLAQAKKNASSWVMDHGIGSVGRGLGLSRASHPLRSFCGEELLAALGAERSDFQHGRKRSFDDYDYNASEDGRRVRARENEGEVELDFGRGAELVPGDEGYLLREEVEIGREAPPSLHDDMSSQMPWNITASLQGSVAGSSSVPRPFTSVDHPSRLPFGSLSRHGGRFPSSSPLAGRSLAFDSAAHDRLSSLSLDWGAGLDDIEMGGAPDLESYTEHAGHSDGPMQPNIFNKQQINETQHTVSSLSQADRNFLGFLQSHFQMHDDGQPTETATVGGVSGIESKKTVAFPILLPPSSTSRIVATQGLMHILALATRNFIAVSQAKTIEGPPCAIDDLGDIYLTIKHSGYITGV